MTDDLHGALRDIEEALEQLHEFAALVGGDEYTGISYRQALAKIKAIRQRVPGGLDESMDTLENTFTGQAALRKAARLLHEITGEKDD